MNVTNLFGGASNILFKTLRTELQKCVSNTEQTASPHPTGAPRPLQLLQPQPHPGHAAARRSPPAPGHRLGPPHWGPTKLGKILSTSFAMFWNMIWVKIQEETRWNQWKSWNMLPILKVVGWTMRLLQDLCWSTGIKWCHVQVRWKMKAHWNHHVCKKSWDRKYLWRLATNQTCCELISVPGRKSLRGRYWCR